MPNFPSVTDVLALLAKKANLPAATGNDGQVLTKNSGTSTGTSWATVGTGGTVSDATTASKGVIRLAGDLAGTADLPTLKQIFNDGSQQFGSSTKVPQITRDAFGRVTGITEVAIQYPTGGGGGGMANPMTSTGDMIVGGASGSPVRLIGSTLAAKRFLVATGNGTSSGTPQWGTVAVADVDGAALLPTKYVGVNQQGGTSYTPSLGDAGKLITMSNTAANTLVLPTNASVAFPVGTYFDVIQLGAGATSFGFVSGVTVNSPNGLLTVAGQYRRVRAIKISTNQWILEGDFASTTSGGGGTTDPGTGGGGTTTPPTTVTNLIASQAIQNAADATKFTAAAATLSIDNTVAKSGGSSIKVVPDGSSAYPYLAPNTPTEWAPVTAGKTYTGFASVRLDKAISAAFQAYLTWYDVNGAQLGTANSAGQVTGVQNSWVQVSSSGVAPAGAVAAAVVVEYGAAGADLLATNTIHVDEIGVNLGTSTTWTGGNTSSGGTTSPATITDAGFSYSANWATASNPSEHYSSTVGATASVTFTLNGPATFSLIGKLDSSNGTMSASVDGGSPISINLSQTTTQDQATVWTSAQLATGQHTIVFTITSPDGSIQGAKVSNGTFKAPDTTTQPPTGGTGGGTGTTGGNTTINGIIIGGAASSNPSGYAPPTTDAYPGYTNVLSEDFSTAFSEGRANGINVLGSGWFSYEGQENGNYDGMNWDTDQISAAGSVVTMRNTNAGGNCQALVPIFRDSANSGKTPKAQGILYGKTMIRMKARGSAGYKIAFLMWPSDPYGWDSGEIDFPEGDTVSPDPSRYPYTMTAASHHLVNNMADMIFKDAANVSGLGSKGVIDDGKWHTFTLHWDQNKIVFEMDGVVMNTITDTAYIPHVPMRWVLQCEPTNGGESNAANYIDIDWVSAWKKG